MCAPGNQDESDDVSERADNYLRRGVQTATETKALQEGCTPRELCDKYHAIHKGIYEWFGIDFTHFGRTTTGQQTEICQDMFLKLHENGFTSTQSVDQLFCNKCDKFLADRFVTGTCPMCAYDDARGDQCDGCGKLINAVELKDAKCDMCKGPPEVKQSTHIFLSLDKLQQKTTDHLDKELAKEDYRWSANAVGITRAWMKLGLDPRCITRDLKGGPGGPGGYNEGQGGAGGFPEGSGGFQGGAGGAGNGSATFRYQPFRYQPFRHQSFRHQKKR
ncbi:unnamed protein product [Caenorhabditis sp. 36 PRJEB53466]|nr:unnamed protein product [Caenorhabditis sp. 36 PRJEB53466]